MELQIKLNSSWISTFKNPNVDFENEYKRDYLPNQIYNFKAIIQHESSLKNVNNSKIHQVNDERTIKFRDGSQSWTLQNTDTNNIHDNNNSDYLENSSTSKDKLSFKRFSNDNSNIRETSSETNNQDLDDIGFRFETTNQGINDLNVSQNLLIHEDKIKPEISMKFENSLKIENFQNSGLQTIACENENFKSEESSVKDTSKLMLHSSVKSILNDISGASDDFSNNNLSNNKYYMKEDTTFSNKDFRTRNNEIEDQLCNQILTHNSNESNENLVKIENCNLEYESGNLETSYALNENENVKNNYPNTNVFEYLKENINTSDGNEKITYPNKDKHNEIQTMKMKNKNPQFDHHEPKLCNAKTIDFSTINENGLLFNDINSKEIVKPINDKFLYLEKDREMINDKIVETEIFQKISPSTSSQNYIPNSKESFETKLDKMKDNFENYLSDENGINTYVLHTFHQNLTVNDVSEEIHKSENNIKTGKNDSAIDKNQRDISRNDYKIESDVVNVKLENEKYNMINLNSSFSNPNEIDDYSKNHKNLKENTLFINDLPKRNDNSVKFEYNNEGSIFGNSDEISLNQKLTPKVSENKLKEKLHPTDNFYESDLNEKKHDNKINGKSSESVTPDNLNFVKKENFELELENDSYFADDFMSQKIEISNKENKNDNSLNTENISDQLFPNNNLPKYKINDINNYVASSLKNSDTFVLRNDFCKEMILSKKDDIETFKFMPVLDEFQNDKNSHVNKNNGNFKNENFVNENIINSSTNPNERNKDMNESFKVIPTHVKEINEDISSFVNIPEENENSFLDDVLQKSDLNNYRNENSDNRKCTNKEPIEMKTTVLDHFESVNNNAEYEFDNFSCNFEQNLSVKVSESKWKENLSKPKSFNEKNLNENANANINKTYFENKNKFNDNYENKIKVKLEDNSFSANNLLFQKHEMSSKENSTDFIENKDNQLRQSKNFLKCKNVDYNKIDDIKNYNPYSGYKYESKNSTRKGHLKSNYCPSTQNLIYNNKIKYSNDLMPPYENKSDIHQINENVFVNEDCKNRNIPIKNMNTTDSISVNTKNPLKVRSVFEDNQKMIEKTESFINWKNSESGKPLCTKCMKYHFRTTSYDTRKNRNLSRPHMGNKNLKSSILSNFPKKIITSESSFAKGKAVSNINTELSILSKCHSKKYNITSNDEMDLNSSIKSNVNFTSNYGLPLDLRVYCRGRLIYEPLF